MPCWVTFKELILLFLITQIVLGIPRLDPLVDTQLGLIKGLSASDGHYSMFLGIPYAKVDEKNLFGESLPYPNFEKPFEAYDDTAICPQKENYNHTIVGTLDCLHLNIYVPISANSKNPVPVMIYVHGGFFKFGFAGRYQYGPKFIVQHDVILVTINYRLGPYGFMCLDIPEVPGNQGLKDQALAFKWVKENINAFGGDSNQITVFGVSAGAHSLDFHLMFGDENLFNNIILQSGSTLASSVMIDQDKDAAVKISEYLGFATNSVKEALSFLSTVNTSEVIKATVDLNMDFKPCVEQQFDNVKPYITESWINKITTKVKGKPILMGYSEYEKLLAFQNPETYSGVDIFDKNLKTTFDFHEEIDDVKNHVRHFYIGDEDINENVKTSLVDFDSDFSYIYPMHRSIQKYLVNQAKNIYFYQFSYTGGRNNGHITNNVTVKGASHSDEVGYLFDPEFIKGEPSPDDQLKINQMTLLWTNFAKYGNPTPEVTDILPVKWTPLTKENYYYLKIDSELTVNRRPKNREMAFWDLFYMLYKESQKGYESL